MTTEEIKAAHRVIADAKAFAAIRHDIRTLHRRKCWPCQRIHWHALNHGQLVACPECGSMDTRLIKPAPCDTVEKP